MSRIKELILDEIALVSGGESMMSAANRGTTRGSTSYGGQANGFQPNYAAAGSSGITKECAAAIATGALGVVGSLPSRNAVSIGSAMAVAGISIGATCDQAKSKSGSPFR